MTWDGISPLVLPKQPETRRLVWLAVVGQQDGLLEPVGCTLKVEDGSLDVARQYLAAATLIDGATYQTMFFFSEDVGNDSVRSYNEDAMATCALGRDCYMDASSKLTIALDVAPSSGTMKVTWVFEDIN